MGHKATDIEKAKRLIILEPLLLEGMSYNSIVQYCAKEWGIKSRETSNYIAEIKDNWLKEQEKVKEKNYAKAIKRREYNYGKQMREHGDKRLAFEWEKDKSRLEGLYEDRIRVIEEKEPNEKEIDEAIEKYMKRNK